MEKSKIMNILGWCFFIISIMVFAPILDHSFKITWKIFEAIHVCKDAGCVLLPIYFGIFLPVSLIFFVLGKYFKTKECGEEIFKTKSAKEIKIRIYGGLVLSAVGWHLSTAMKSWIGDIVLLLGIVFFLSGTVQPVINYFKKN